MSEVQNRTWEQQALEKLALAAIHEQRAARRWKIFFRSIWLVIIALIFAWLLGWFPSKPDKLDKKPVKGNYTASVSMVGEIASHGGEGVVLADQVITSLRNAFEDTHAKGIILRVNSPGGSPVASGRIYDEIQALRKHYPKKPIYTVVDDLCASGCYYVAAATDKVFVNRASMVGSIGVLMNGFGFTGSMEKLGIERRLITAGKNKGFLDPFSPLNQEEKAFTQTLLEDIHQQFIHAVKVGRGNRLRETEETFTGLIWNGSAAIKMGLVDGQGTSDYVAKELIKEPEIVDFTHKRTLSEVLAEQIGASAGASLKALFAMKIQ
jgi:protease-4